MKTENKLIRGLLKVDYRQLVTMGNGVTYWMEVHETLLDTKGHTGYHVSFCQREPMFLVDIFKELKLEDVKKKLLTKYKRGEAASYYPMTDSLSHLKQDINNLIILSYKNAEVTINSKADQIRKIQNDIIAIELLLNNMKLTLETLTQ